MNQAADPGARPKVPNKLYFRIGEVSEITGVQPYTLRHWEMEFPTLSPRKNDAGQRLYRREDIEMVHEIQRLLHLEGYTTAGARRLLSARKQDRAGRAAARKPSAHAGKSPTRAGRPPAPAGKSPAPAGKSPAPAGKSPAPAGKPAARTGKLAAPAAKSPDLPPPAPSPPPLSAESLRKLEKALDLMERNDALLARLDPGNPRRPV